MIDVKPMFVWERLTVASLVFISPCGSLLSSLVGKITQEYPIYLGKCWAKPLPNSALDPGSNLQPQEADNVFLDIGPAFHHCCKAWDPYKKHLWSSSRRGPNCQLALWTKILLGVQGTVKKKYLSLFVFLISRSTFTVRTIFFMRMNLWSMSG